MKKLFAIFLALITVLSLAACGGNTEARTETESGDITVNSSEVNVSSVEQDTFNLITADEAKRVSDLSVTAMKMSKERYSYGEEIKVTLKWTGTPDPSAWLGIVPADIPHGDEFVNDDADIEYIYIAEYDGSEFIFNSDIEPGNYTVRLNDNDSGGAELAWCAFTVTPNADN